MEETECLKPSDSRSQIGDGALDNGCAVASLRRWLRYKREVRRQRTATAPHSDSTKYPSEPVVKRLSTAGRSPPSSRKIAPRR
jgi:hypothetical protein